jgi:hypothetical protein
MEENGCGLLPAVTQRDQTVTKILNLVQFASGPTFEARGAIIYEADTLQLKHTVQHTTMYGVFPCS